MKKPKVHIMLKTVNMNGFNGENAIKEVILLHASSCVSPFSGFAPRAWLDTAGFTGEFEVRGQEESTNN